MKASTHDSGVGVDVAAIECDCATVDVDATSALPNKGSRSVKASIPSGRWDGLMSRKRPTYILRAHKGAIHSTSVKASTPSGRWKGRWWRLRGKEQSPGKLGVQQGKGNALNLW